MRVLLEDGFSIEKGTGVGRYTQNLARELRKYPNVEILPLAEKDPIGKIQPSTIRRIAYTVWLETAFQNTVERLRPDLIHFTNYLVPREHRTNAKYAVSIHDLTPWRLPEALPLLYRGYIRRAVSRAVKVADLILCPSHSIRNEVIEHFSLDGRRVRAAWNGHSQMPEIPAERRKELSQKLFSRIDLKKPFVLFVGTLERRKNLTTLAEAFARVVATFDLQCVLAGRPGYGFPEIKSSIERQACRDRYILPGFLTDEELALLYTLAEVFVFPSKYEGFGTPLVEAMCFGLPIVASHIPSSEEVAGDAAMYYEDPEDHAALAEKILEVLSNSSIRAELALRGKERSEKFSWKHIGWMHIDAYNSTLNGH